MLWQILLIVGGSIAAILLGLIILIARTHKKVPQGRALIRTGFGGIKVAFDSGMFVIPVLHKVEEMDISLKTIEVNRVGVEGLICQDNMRADIKVVFFVRVNKEPDDIVEVAQTIGTARASDQITLNNLFDAKFSEALKTVGKQFDFVELYTVRNQFKVKILETIGTDLNGYILDDCAIDFLEQTPISSLKQENILDAEGIKKIEELTSIQIEKTNFIRREREKTIKKQDVEAREAILQLELQQTEKEERQKRAIAILKTEQENQATREIVSNNLKTSLEVKSAEREEGIAEENKLREIIVAKKNKERTEAVENERIETDRLLEVERKERSVGEAKIDKEKALEIKKRDIQAIIKERKAEEKKTIEEDQRIQDTIQLSEAERSRQVTIIKAQELGEGSKIKETKQAESEKIVAEIKALQIVIEAEARKTAQVKDAEARKIAAEARAAEEATVGLAEADVMIAQADAKEKQGMMEARLTEQKAFAEAKALEAMAEAERKKGMAIAEVNKEQGGVGAIVTEQQGLAEAKVTQEKGNSEANVIELRMLAEAKGISAKAEAMKLLDGVGKDHEEFKLRLDQQRIIMIAEIDARRAIAEAQATVLGQGLSNARIDIVGGETQFFNSIIDSIGRGKSVDRLMDNSVHLNDIKDAILSGGEDGLLAKIREFAKSYGINTEALRDLTMSALMSRLYTKASDTDKDPIIRLIDSITRMGISDENAGKILS
jgi:flotillin